MKRTYSLLIVILVAFTIGLSGETQAASTSTYACIAGDNKYSCSSDGSLAGCQNLPSCKSGAKTQCGEIPDKAKCGQTALTSDPLPGQGGFFYQESP
ncbi:MAG: hypothetical protein KW806_03520 [Candidatus Yanofskybacteria bacterium]|nr:hypothetical protein [Candidatus Yanofskybacteria bacterium]